MGDNSNDLCWVKYLKRVQFEKNTMFPPTVGMTPYEALYLYKLVDCLISESLWNMEPKFTLNSHLIVSMKR